VNSQMDKNDMILVSVDPKTHDVAMISIPRRMPPYQTLGDLTLTFAGIGVYRQDLLHGQQAGKYSIVPILRAAFRSGRVSGEHFHGHWSDVGTPQRLAYVNEILGG